MSHKERFKGGDLRYRAGEKEEQRRSNPSIVSSSYWSII